MCLVGLYAYYYCCRQIIIFARLCGQPFKIFGVSLSLAPFGWSRILLNVLGPMYVHKIFHTAPMAELVSAGVHKCGLAGRKPGKLS